LPEKFTISIEINISKSYKFLNLSPNIEQDLIEAWTELYNTEEDSSVKFIINEVPDRLFINRPKNLSTNKNRRNNFSVTFLYYISIFQQYLNIEESMIIR
jgi:hypothetical protein